MLQWLYPWIHGKCGDDYDGKLFVVLTFSYLFGFQTTFKRHSNNSVSRFPLILLISSLKFKEIQI